jgi:hypothetical protein
LKRAFRLISQTLKRGRCFQRPLFIWLNFDLISTSCGERFQNFAQTVIRLRFVPALFTPMLIAQSAARFIAMATAVAIDAVAMTMRPREQHASRAADNTADHCAADITGDHAANDCAGRSAYACIAFSRGAGRQSADQGK